MKKYYLLLFCMVLGISGIAQIINIPDANFKNALVNTVCVAFSPGGMIYSDADTNNDGEIEVTEAMAVYEMNISNHSISSVEGLQYFLNLQDLICDHNSIISLDLSQMTHMYQLECNHNALTSLLFYNAGTTDFYLNCSYNQLTTLDLGTLKYGTMNCEHNLLTSVNASQVQSLYDGYFNDNQLTSLVIAPNLNNGFEVLNISNNPLTSFVLTNGGINFTCSGTTAVFLDFSHGSASSYMIGSNPNLQYLNFKNGFLENSPIVGGPGPSIFNISNNPSLQFVCCDDLGNDLGTELNALQQRINDPNVSYTNYCSFTPGGNYNTISGNINFDCTGVTIPLFNQRIAISGGGAIGNTFTNTNGVYALYSSLGSQTITPQLTNPSFFIVTPASYTYNFTTGGNTQTANFCITPNGTHPDLAVSILPLTAARPGFDASYKIKYTNNGNQTQDGTVSLTFDDAILDFVSAVPTVSTAATNLLHWDFTALAPFESREITVSLNLNSPAETPAVNISDVLHYTAGISSITADETPADNSKEYSQTVVGSYDPNDKEVVEGLSISSDKLGEYLHYVVRFQNTGTAAAENIVVKDMLDANLDWSTLQMESSSHPFRSTLTLGNKLEVFYEGITLPPSSTDEPASHGYIAFKVKPKNTLVVNDVIANTANIYFDYNFPIVTNTVTTTVTALGTSSFNHQELFSIYPNPTHGILNIVLANNATPQSVIIYNMLGQKVLSSDSQTSLNVNDLPKGTYLIKVTTEGGSATQRFIKK